MKSLDSTTLRSSRDSSYGRLLRRLDQAMDMACTRQWLTGQTALPGELEIEGLSNADLQLLDQIMRSMNLDPSASPAAISSLAGTRQQTQQH
ncbi:hypothetical protein [Halopseudomonas pertucinogena]|uniref:Uncharacterized protein n=1 Tax=Halopseudomonas pertucinogena TaxID=86175 RepID=A0ABQ2CNX5_9GAMM|nr:hypothetical protein [Halopseudomonas pertucinogena]GGI99116.1 hypothetical protein GCM10009083_14780 [Halopseudomonas pertucinogena]